MFYKLSNIANVEDMEMVFGATFKYPDIYLKNPLINGLDEQLLPVITDDNLEQIQFGIWGILPEGYKEDWEVYQKNQNTLNLHLDSLKYMDNFSIEKRCVVLVSGFFTMYLHKGELYPFYAYPKSKKPFAIAGIYNKTYDGFITSGLLLTKLKSAPAKYHNINKTMPAVIAPNNYEKWLGEDYVKLLHEDFEDFANLDFQYHPIAREFYKNEIRFESFLDPADYESLAIPFSTGHSF